MIYIKDKIHISDLNNLILSYIKEGKLTNTEIARKLNIRKENGSYDLEPIKVIRTRPKVLISENIKKFKTYSLTLFTHSEYDSAISIRCIIKENGTFKNKGKIIKKRLSTVKQYYIKVETKKFREKMARIKLAREENMNKLPEHLRQYA